MIKIYENFFEDSDLKIIRGYLQNPIWRAQKSSLAVQREAMEEIVREQLKNSTWTAEKSSDDDGNFQMYDVSDIEYFNTELLEYINSKLDSDFKLERIYVNGQDYGHDGEWHPDSDIGYTHLTYLNPDVSPHWGGETQFEETSGVIKQVSPQYNTSVIFKGSIPHRGLAFNKEGTPKRISLAFKLLPNTKTFGKKEKPVNEPQSIAHKIPMEQHIKPAVIVGSAKFDTAVVEEIIAETDFLRESGESHGSKLVGQLKSDKRSKQLSFDMDNDVGKLLKKVFDSVGDRYLQEMLGVEAKSDCFEIWSNHAYAGDYNPLHTHGTATTAGLSGFMWLKNPPCIEEKWNSLIESEQLAKEFPDIKETGNLPSGVTPQLTDAAGGIDGWTCMVWNPSTGQDTEMLKPHGQCYLKPTVGQMFIFPSWLHHEVYPFFGEGERLSIAMNWNVQFSDEYMLRGASEEARKQYYEKIEQQKLDQEILAKAKEDGFWEK